jgi:hypothetical protein
MSRFDLLSSLCVAVDLINRRRQLAAKLSRAELLVITNHANQSTSGHERTISIYDL